MRLTGIRRRWAGRLAAAVGCVALAACASIGRPPGGPTDLDPPEVVSASIDTNAVGVRAGRLELTFNEVISERPSVSGPGTGPVTLESVILISPRTGSPKVDWNRESISIEPRGGFRPNTTYRITLLPGLADLRGNVTSVASTYVFSTGPTILPYAILGRVFDWQTGLTAPGAVVEAVANAGTPDSSIYIAIADTVGQFDLGPLAAGRYHVRTFIDADRNRDRGVLEKWDTVTVTVTDHRPSIELLAAQRDTAVIGIARVEALDSLWIRVTLDKPFDQRASLQPSMVAVQRSDSSELQVAGLLTEDQAAFLRPRSDSAGVANAPPPAPAPRPETGGTRPPPLRPAAPAPQTVVVVRLDPSTPLRTGERYVLTLRGLRNLIGRTAPATSVFEGPRAPARPPS